MDTVKFNQSSSLGTHLEDLGKHGRLSGANMSELMRMSGYVENGKTEMIQNSSQ